MMISRTATTLASKFRSLAPLPFVPLTSRKCPAIVQPRTEPRSEQVVPHSRTSGGAYVTKQAGSSSGPAPVMSREEWQMHPAGRTGLQFYDLSHPFGPNAPLWPYFEDVKIERLHYHAKSGVLSQRISTVMHCTTHLYAPAHVVEGTPYTDEVPLEQFFGTGVAVSI